jgi:hypothetical protein
MVKKKAKISPAKAKKIYKDVADTIAEHVDANRGMTNKILNSACDSVAPFFAQCRLSSRALIEVKEARGGRRRRLAPSKSSADCRRSLKVKLKKGDILFKGVYCSDELPAHLTESRKPFSLIVNLAARGKKAAAAALKDPFVIPPDQGHFVFLSATDKDVYYVDPFGEACHHPSISAFIEKLSRTRSRSRAKKKKSQYHFNPNRIQGLFSVCCGMYNILFMMATEGGISLDMFPFCKTNLKRNDSKCIQYINLLLKSLC